MQMKPTIYWHVGLGRTATTFTQTQIFPKLKGIHYIPKKGFRDADKVLQEGSHEKILLSHEIRRTLADELKSFSKKYPDARIIIVFRRHDKWIASHYKRVVKNGHPWIFSEYFDIRNDQGVWKKQDLYYYPKIESILKNFRHKPLVLFHHDLKDRPEHFLKQIMNYLEIDRNDEIDFTPRHTSYNDKELKVRRWISRNTFLREKQYVDKHSMSKLIKFGNKVMRYSALYLAKAIPNAWISQKPLIPKEEMSMIRDFYEEDWQQCLEFARNNNDAV
jgi:hypothetical protein